MSDRTACHAELQRLMAQGDVQQAHNLAQTWLATHADDVLAWQILGNASLYLADPVAAEAAYRNALQHQPDLARNRANLAIALLAQGRYAEAWPLYEARFDPSLHAHDKVQFGTLPIAQRWQGEALTGKRILVVREQGFGDQIQFIRLAPQLKQMGAAQVRLWAAQPLADLMQRAAGVDAVEVTQPADHTYDLWVALMSLPMHLGVSAPQSAPNLSYLSATTQHQQQWQKQLAAWTQGKLSFGLVWAGSPGNSVDVRRSLPIEAVFDLLSARGNAIPISLQLGTPGMERLYEQCAQGLIPLLDLLRDFSDTAAAMASLNLVITVDTAVAHLAGACGRPVWLLLPKGADWRWGQHGNTTPWYPSMRIFRQQHAGDWQTVLAEVKAALQQWANASS